MLCKICYANSVHIANFILIAINFEGNSIVPLNPEVWYHHKSALSTFNRAAHWPRAHACVHVFDKLCFWPKASQELTQHSLCKHALLYISGRSVKVVLSSRVYVSLYMNVWVGRGRF